MNEKLQTASYLYRSACSDLLYHDHRAAGTISEIIELVDRKEAEAIITALTEEWDTLHQKYCALIDKYDQAAERVFSLTNQAQRYREALQRLASPKAFTLARWATEEEKARMKFAESSLSLSPLPEREAEREVTEDDTILKRRGNINFVRNVGGRDDMGRQR